MKLVQWMHRPARGASFLSVTLILALVIYALMIFGTLAHLEQVSGLTPFDMRPGGYDYEAATDLLSALGASGRAFYVWVQLPLDLFYPLFFAISFSGFLFHLAHKISLLPDLAGRLSLLPFLAMMADYVENGFVAVMVLSFPALSPLVVNMASIATVTKSILVTLVFCLFLILVLVYLLRRVVAWRSVSKGN